MALYWALHLKPAQEPEVLLGLLWQRRVWVSGHVPALQQALQPLQGQAAMQAARMWQTRAEA